ncbi:hypothetical protein ACFVUS_28555 [Nocardia sp. NPDC058058]|uniref:DUF6630 family protein n=1 Tax=Nocardia sp. NPDC058058 TaxID=3346317 RepID=UPI0036DB5866
MAREIFEHRTQLVDAVQVAIDDPDAYVKDRPWMGGADRDDLGWEALIDQMQEPCDAGENRLVTFDWQASPDWIREGVQWLIHCFTDYGPSWDWFDARVADLIEKGWDSGDIAYNLLKECGQRSLEIGLALISFTRGDSNEVMATNMHQADLIVDLATQAGHGRDIVVLRRT